MRLAGALLSLLVGCAPEISVGPRVSVVNRGSTLPDIGAGVAGAIIWPTTPIQVGLRGGLYSTGFVARSPGFYADALGAASADWGRAGAHAGAGASVLSMRVCGAEYCGRQTGIVPSASLGVRYRAGDRFALVLEGYGYWVPRSVVLPGFSGRATLGGEWTVGARP